MDIPIYYDPMIAKLIAFGKDREEAISRLIRAIDEYKIIGVETTLPFCKFVLKHEAFVSGHFDTHFVNKYFSPEKLFTENEEEAFIASFVSSRLLNSSKSISVNSHQRTASNWKKNRISTPD